MPEHDHIVTHELIRNTRWGVWVNSNGKFSIAQVDRAILLDIREELRAMNKILSCRNCLDIPELLRQIVRNTTKRKYKRKVKP